MTKKERAQAYQAKNEKNNPQAEAYDFASAYSQGYDDGFMEGRQKSMEEGFNQALEKACELISGINKILSAQSLGLLQIDLELFRKAMKE